eukprot:TRINITY_DN13505_c0_g1_i1.p1 TRINITY_DN13505_c0_g1~~TRINITY_DN13505_c0_g1_i1.p1  ORF type:complete len:291 (-),score=30.94 TRINITY_DN13505_c0_g1_i1:32-904(-)
MSNSYGYGQTLPGVTEPVYTVVTPTAPVYPPVATSGSQVYVGLPDGTLPYAAPQVGYPADASQVETENRTSEMRTTMINRLYNREYTVSGLLWITQGYELFKENWKIYLPWGILYFAVSLASGWFPPIFLLAIPLQVSLWYATFNAIRTTGAAPLHYSQFLEGMKLCLPFFLLTLLQALVVAVGLICFILPGLHLLFSLSFAGPIYLEFKSVGITIDDSLKISLHVVRKNLWAIIGFILLNSLMALGGSLLLLVGAFATLPISQIAFCYATKDIFGLRDHHEYCILNNLP